MNLDQKNFTAKSSPYLHFVSPNFISEDEADDILGVLERFEGWRRHRSSFFDQDEISSFANWEEKGVLLQFLELHRAELLALMSRLFEQPFSSRVTLSVHRLREGQGIGVHNDYVPEVEESHRLNIQLNRGWEPSMGGVLLLLGSDSLSDIRVGIVPQNRQAIAFQFSPHSWHAVSDVVAGERFTLIFSFWSLA